MAGPSKPTFPVLPLIFGGVIALGFISLTKQINLGGFYYERTLQAVFSLMSGDAISPETGMRLLQFTPLVAQLLALLTYILGLWALLGLLAPVLIRATQSFPARVDFERYELGDPDVELAVANRMESAALELKPLGFELRGHYKLLRGAPNTRGYVSLFENRRNGDLAKVIAATTAVRVVDYCVFITDYDDGVLYWTSNNAVPLVTPTMPSRPGSLGFPQVSRLDRLYELHLAGRQDGPGRVRVADDPAAYLRREERVLARWVEAGTHYLDEDAGLYRLTWWGACSMTWLSLWPVPPLRRWLRRRRAARAIQDRGLA